MFGRRPDASLVRDVHKSRTKQRLLTSVLEVSHDFDATVIAEGIECKEEFETLLDMGCDLFQGFYFARPGRPFPAVLR